MSQFNSIYSILSSKQILNDFNNKKGYFVYIPYGFVPILFQDLIFTTPSQALEEISETNYYIPKFLLGQDYCNHFIRRPPNSFILFRCAIKDAVKKKYPNKNNNEISKTIGNMWHALSNEEKKRYRNKATDLKNSYFQKKKKRVKNDQSVDVEYKTNNDGKINQDINKTNVININEDASTNASFDSIEINNNFLEKNDAYLNFEKIISNIFKF